MNDPVKALVIGYTIGPVLKILAFLVVVFLVIGKNGSPVEPKLSTMSYDQLMRYPVDCSLKNTQLTELKSLQRDKNFDPDPDKLTEGQRAYNSRLKATIWWYAYRCDQS